ncbi:hypothetical protein AMTRI_Chr08g164930 [Amborella trichopoda]|uniref:Uncharacterized protein n=1 Tax=Amborella trichopoda TaxID=13333 RepID=W1P4T8_AMBTC|nr:uncharacterized protein LOC110007162 [Amborella trichopoda]ERN04897.1 hypothetical protein AMTR_s00080p00043600 [Amborella trichopoda]|eukprot:XP_020522180.1 uncharacterized protein LOC110007162 [Amborella trichopoda]
MWSRKHRSKTHAIDSPTACGAGETIQSPTCDATKACQSPPPFALKVQSVPYLEQAKARAGSCRVITLTIRLPSFPAFKRNKKDVKFSSKNNLPLLSDLLANKEPPTTNPLKLPFKTNSPLLSDLLAQEKKRKSKKKPSTPVSLVKSFSHKVAKISNRKPRLTPHFEGDVTTRVAHKSVGLLKSLGHNVAKISNLKTTLYRQEEGHATIKVAVKSVRSRECSLEKRSNNISTLSNGNAGSGSKATSLSWHFCVSGSKIRTMISEVMQRPKSALNTVKELGGQKVVEWTKRRWEGGRRGIWEKRILMGKRCRPLDFPGVLHYDHKGNRLQQLPPSLEGHQTQAQYFGFAHRRLLESSARMIVNF